MGDNPSLYDNFGWSEALYFENHIMFQNDYHRKMEVK
jgi:hypothetical protein